MTTCRTPTVPVWVVLVRPALTLPEVPARMVWTDPADSDLPGPMVTEDRELAEWTAAAYWRAGNYSARIVQWVPAE